MLVARHRQASWFHAEGASIKRAEIERKGVPKMRDWRMITLTLDPSKFAGPKEGYEAGRDQMRRFLYSLREYFGRANWCWKMEFHRSGWVHWHVCFGYRRRMSESELRLVEVMWGLGRTNVQRIRSWSFAYLFKYISKAAYRGGDGASVPSWFQDHASPGVPSDAEGVGGSLPGSYARARFWQTSKGFYTGKKKPVPPPMPPTFNLLSFPVRQVLEEAARRVRVFARSPAGAILKSCVISLVMPWKSGSDRIFAILALSGQAAAVDSNSYVVPLKEISKLCPNYQRGRLQKVTQSNRKSPAQEINLYRKQLLLAAGLPF